MGAGKKKVRCWRDRGAFCKTERPGVSLAGTASITELSPSAAFLLLNGVKTAF
jgi:hypothetical protein